MLQGYRTFIAAAVALLGEALRLSGIDIDTSGLTESIMVIGGMIGAIYFRAIAKPKA